MSVGVSASDRSDSIQKENFKCIGINASYSLLL